MLSRSDLDEILHVPDIATPQSAPPLGILQQLMRGGMRGASLGFAPDPWQGSPAGGMAETVGEIAGGLAPAALLTPLAGAGVAAGARLFPSLLRSGVTGAEALSKMRPGFAGINALSGRGQMAALGGATAMQTGLEQVNDPERSVLFPTLMSMGIGGALAKFGSKAPAGKLDEAVDAVAGKITFRSEQIPIIEAKIAELELEKLTGNKSAAVRKAYDTAIRELQGRLQKVISEGRAPENLANRAAGSTGLAPPPAVAGSTLGRQMNQRGTSQIAEDLERQVVRDPAVQAQAGMAFPPRGPSAPRAGLSAADDLAPPVSPASPAAEAVAGPQGVKYPAGAEMPPGPTSALSGLSPEQVQMILRQAGISAMHVTPDRARELAEEILTRKALPQTGVGGTPASTNPRTGVFGPEVGAIERADPLLRPPYVSREGEKLLGYKVAKPGEEGGLVPPGKTPVSTEGIINPRDPNSVNAWRSRIRASLGMDATEEEIQLAMNVGRKLGRGGSDNFDLAAQARAGLGSPVDDGVRIASSAGIRDSLAAGNMAPNILSSGFNRGFVKRLVEKAPFLPLTWKVAGTEAEPLPYLLNKMEGQMEGVTGDFFRSIPNVMKWSPETKKKVKDLFFEHAKGTREELDAAIQRQVPEAMAALPELRELMDTVRMNWILDGVLKPEQALPNYFPVVRDALRASATGTLSIERGGGEYIPRMIADSIRARMPDFAKKRVWTEMEDMPKVMSFDEVLQIYAKQYARHQVVQDGIPEINRLVQGLQEPALRQMVGEHLNHWLGATAKDESYGRMAMLIRDLQFQRTIGMNVLTPLINTLQRLNTFAMVHPTSFAQAFADRQDPERLRIAVMAGLDLTGAGLEKMGVANLGRGGVYPTAARTLKPLIGEERSEQLSAFAEKLQTKASKLFEMSERGNKVHAFLAGLREAERQGVGALPEQIEFARRIMQETQFIQSAANAPAWARTELGKTLMQFQSFRMNQVHFMLRLADTAIQGAKQGDFSKVAPFLRFWVPSVALGGVALPGDWMHDGVIRSMFGRTMMTEGIPELFGLSLTHQLGLGSIGAEDLNSFFFYIPGPAAGHLQSILGATTGMSFGRGLDVSNFGQELSPQSRAGLAAQSFPIGGIQLNRAIQALRLFQNDGEYRKSLDMSEAFGLTPSSGPLMADKAATLTQQYAQAIGLQSSDREQQRKTQDSLSSMQKDLSAAQRKAAEFLAAGRRQDAWNVMEQFRAKHEDQLGLTPPPAVSGAALRRAQDRMSTGPTDMKLKTLPKYLRQTEAAMGPPPSLWSNMVWGEDKATE